MTVALLPSRRAAALFAAVALLVSLPSLLFGPAATHSYLYNYIWGSQFGEAMASGNLYPRWLPDSFEGLGSPAFYFYPPLAYWLSGALNALGLPIFKAVDVAGMILLFLSGVTMHSWLAARGTRPVVGALIYMIAPYHLFDLTVRGALAEFCAYVMLPLVALGVQRLPDRRGVILLALAYGGMLLSHLPTALLTGVFLIAPMLLHKTLKRPTVIPAGATAGLLAFALAAFYLLPALTLQDHISTNLLWADSYHASHWSIWNLNFHMFGFLCIALILLAWPARSFWSILAVVTALASIRLIPFIWDIQLLDRVQFPWRLFMIAEFATITAMVSYQPWRKAWTLGAGMILLPYVMVATASHQLLGEGFDPAIVARIMPDAPEYLPHDFDERLITPTRWTDVSRWRTLPRGDTIRVDKAGTVTTGRMAFPIWRVTKDGAPIASTGPLIRFNAQPGIYRIERVRLWQERVGDLISIGAIVLLALGMIRMKKAGAPRTRTELAAC